jgi:hypothetical protein
MDLQIWSTEYAIRRIRESTPDSFLVLAHSRIASVDGPAIAGYDGPQFHIAPTEPGLYVVRFDSTSEFQAEMDDSAFFTVQPSSGVRPSSRMPKAREPREMYRLNGERAFRTETMPAFVR